jgi:hypothetical protein
MTLIPVGTVVKRTEAWHQNRRFHRGSGWSERERHLFREWEAKGRADRWTVVAHLAPSSEHNASAGWAYKLQRGATVSYSLPYDWMEAS